MSTTPPTDPWAQAPSGPPTAGPTAPVQAPGTTPTSSQPSPSSVPPPPPAPNLTGQVSTTLGWGGTQLPPPGGQIRVAREHGVADIIDFAFGMLRAVYRQIVGVVVVLGGAGLLLFGVSFTISQSFADGTFNSVDPLWWWALGIGGLLLAIGGIATEPAVIHVALIRARGENPRIMTSVWHGIRKVPGLAVVWTALMVAALLPVILAGLLSLAADILALLFIPAVPITFGFVLVAMMVGHLMTAATVAESMGAWKALSRVRGLLRGQFWRTFGRGLLFGIMIQIIAFIAQFGSFAGLAFGDAGAVIAQILGLLLQFLVLVPLTALAALGLYADLRLRAEGVDELVLL